MEHYFETYERTRESLVRPLPENWEKRLGNEIKWSQDVRRNLEKDQQIDFDEGNIVPALYRPFVKMAFYYSKWANWSLYQMPKIFPNNQNSDGQVTIAVSASGTAASFHSLATKYVSDYHLTGDL